MSVDTKYILVLRDLHILVERKKIKNLHLRVGRTGKISLTAPLFVSGREIEKFASDKYTWLKKHLEGVKAENYRSFTAENCVAVFGKVYSLQCNAAVNGVYGDTFCLKCARDSAEEHAKKILRKILAEKINERLPFWEERTGLKASSFVIRDMKTRWGTCNVRTGRICFNLQLVKKSEECLDYIIVHELGHLINRYHDKRFYNYMKYNFKDYERVRRLLNE